MLSGLVRRTAPWFALVWAAALVTSCATSSRNAAPNRPFDFKRDTFAYANELVWEYRFDEGGKWTSRPREPKPGYTHRCFAVARSARQFFEQARFDPHQPKAAPEENRRLIRQVVRASARYPSPDAKKVVIPGYANLREFSADNESLLKEQCGGPLQSYVQRGHWRMIFPFSRRHQERTADRLVAELRRGRPAVVHGVCFPSLKINHALLLFDAAEDGRRIQFAAYDPNSPESPTVLTYDRADRTFRLPTNFYFPGGRVDIYEIYRNACY
jgi:hypothetical protein